LVVFWIFVLVLIGVSLAFILPPLLRKQRNTQVGYRESNITVQRNRREELDRMLLDGDIDQDAYDEARRELELELHDELASDPTPSESLSETRPVAAIIVAVLLPVAAISLYFLLGSPEALFDGAARGAGGRSSGAVAGGSAQSQMPHSVEEMVERLAQRLEEDPEDPEGWLMLGRSYAAMKRFPEARAALQEAIQRRPGEPTALVALAEVEAALNGNNLTGKATELVNEALEIDPNLVRGLWLAGIAAFNQGDSNRASVYWQRILENPDIDDATASRVRQAIAQLQQMSSGMAQASPSEAKEDSKAGTKGLTVAISLAPELKGMVSTGDTLFVFARAAEGPRMPLAIVRKTAGELPTIVRLDDSMAMAPQLRLSAYPSVVVGARISKSGNATPQPGDLSGTSPVVSLSQAEVVDLVIDDIEK
jgi:cytochrome c-type biogenesis protein CcmH